MTDPRVTKLADVLVNYSVKVQPGEWTHILASVESLPWRRKLLRRCWLLAAITL